MRQHQRGQTPPKKNRKVGGACFDPKPLPAPPGPPTRGEPALILAVANFCKTPDPVFPGETSPPEQFGLSFRMKYLMIVFLRCRK